MSRRRLATCSAFVLALAASIPAAADAQQLTRSGSRARPAVITQEDIWDAAARAEGFAQSGQFAQARQAYREASMLQLRVRELPESSMWQIAQAYYAEGSLRRAAQTLEELATLAGARHDCNVQAKALLEAAFLYRAAGQYQRPREIARTLRTLSQEPTLQPELRSAIEQRIGNFK